ncbi:hypothetical protein ECANGB1_1654 [Enterospora canceri]|uniref:Uncharacterized protein n=1 Tax=Enterospora canceri TaxID=1081671 RepID=A0A1Y1S940_9MICR|nr:hypothetical protein ECANGB1_1654 [Enterospora canceri]
MEYTIDLFESNYAPIVSDTATGENYAMSFLIGSAIVALPVAGSKNRWVATLSLLCCLVFSVQEKIKTVILVASTRDYVFLKGTSDMLQQFSRPQLFVVSIVIAAVVNYFFTQLMYFIVFIFYVSAVFAASMKYKNELNEIVSNAPDDVHGVIRFLHNPLVAICILYVVYYFIRNIVVALLFAVLGTMMVGMMVEIVAGSGRRQVHEMFLDLKRGVVSDYSALGVLLGVSVFFVTLQYNLWGTLMRRLTRKRQKKMLFTDPYGKEMFVM